MKRISSAPMLAALVAVSVGFALSSSSAAARAQGESPPLSLRDAISQALERDPAVERARKSVEIGESNYRLAISRLYPTIDFTIDTTYRKDALNIGSPRFGGESYNQYQVSFKAVQPIFRSGAVLAGLAAARKDKDIRRIDLEIAERDLSKTVISAFYRVLLNDSRLRSLEKLRALDEKMLETAQKRYQIGREQLTDVLQIKTQVALLAPEIQSAENALEVSAAELAGLLGKRSAPEIVLAGALPKVDLAKIVGKARNQQSRIPEFERISSVEEQFLESRRVQLAQHYPQLNAVASMGRSAYDKSELLDQYSTSWSLGAQLVIPIFSGLSSVQDRTRLAAEEAQIQADRVRLEDQVSLNQIRSEKDLELARKQLESWALASRYATESLQEAEKSYRLQTIDYLRLLNAQAKHLDSQVSFEKAKYDAIVAAAQFYVTSGLSLSDLIKEIAP